MQERREAFSLHRRRRGFENDSSRAIALQGACHSKCVLCGVEDSYLAARGVANQDITYPCVDSATIFEN